MIEAFTMTPACIDGRPSQEDWVIDGRRWRRVSFWLAFAAMAGAGAGPGRTATERPVAPLPDGIAALGKPPVKGVYAELNFSLTSVTEDLQSFEEACRARGMTPDVAGRALLDRGRRRLYRAGNTVAAFDDNPAMTSDPDRCTARVSLKRRVHTGSWKTVGASYWTTPLPTCRRFQRCRYGVVAGVRAKCIDEGDGLVGRVVCYSREPGLSNGLMLSLSNYSDDGSGPDNAWILDTVMLDALIDPVVFERGADRP